MFRPIEEGFPRVLRTPLSLNARHQPCKRPQKRSKVKVDDFAKYVPRLLVRVKIQPLMENEKVMRAFAISAAFRLSCDESRASI
jgi:hypothetical protein